MSDFYRLFIIVAVLAVQYFLSSRNRVYWGGILPVAYVVFLTWMLATNRMESMLAYSLYLLLGLFFLMVEWNGGRRYLREKRERELEKMKTYDMR